MAIFESLHSILGYSKINHTPLWMYPGDNWEYDGHLNACPGRLEGIAEACPGGMEPLTSRFKHEEDTYTMQ